MAGRAAAPPLRLEVSTPSGRQAAVVSGLLTRLGCKLQLAWAAASFESLAAFEPSRVVASGPYLVISAPFKATASTPSVPDLVGPSPFLAAFGPCLVVRLSRRLVKVALVSQSKQKFPLQPSAKCPHLYL